MTIAIGVLALVVGWLIGSAMAYDKGWRAGVSWCQAKVFGH